MPMIGDYYYDVERILGRRLNALEQEMMLAGFGLLPDTAPPRRPYRDPEEVARKLAWGFLTEKQRADVKAHEWFEVRSNRRHYWRIHCYGGTTMNVQRIRRIGPWRIPMPLRYCAALWYSYPVWDTYIAQMFMLQTDEMQFRRIANRLP